MFLTNKMLTPFASAQTRRRGVPGQLALPVALLCLGLMGCGTDSRPVGTVGYVQGFAGMVVADEPRAAMVGSDVLSAGGSPADAVVAMAFTMAVTLPSQASLGAGGSCLVFNREPSKVEALDFIAPPPARIGGTVSRPSAIPTMPRGLYALYAKYGRLRWERLLSPAEGMARLGVPASRAFVSQLAAVSAPLFEDQESRRAFAKADGRRLDEGDMMVQPNLGATLSRLRVRGVGEFYSGSWASEIVASVEKAGGSLSVDELRSFVPKWYAPIAVPYGFETAYFPPPPAAAGLLEAEYWSLLTGDDAYADADADVKPHFLAEVLDRGLADRKIWLNPEGTTNQAPDAVMASEHLKSLMAGYAVAGHTATSGEAPTDPVAGTGLAAIDSAGNAVACTIGLNNTFGTGRLVPDLGFYLAAAPGLQGRGPYAMGPMLAVNPNSNEIRFAGAPSNGVTASAALVEVALKALVEDRPLAEAQSAPRLFATPAPDAVFVEPGYKDSALLSARGHDVKETPMVGRVNAIRCKSGEPNPARCKVVTDPRGAGLAIIVGQD